MRKEIEEYITNNYFELLKISKTITKNHDLHQDLLHEVILQLYDKDDIILKEYSENQIRYFIVAIMRINWFSKTSPFYYRVRREMQKYVDITEILQVEDDQQNFEKEMIFNILETSFCELSWFHKSMIQMYLVLGSLKKVSNQTDIPLTSVARYVKEAKEQIKNDITNYKNSI
jgi:DNA-directed RNA polymerase specialized sigma24 family protein